MKVLLTGAGGQLGRELLRRQNASRLTIIAADRSILDITNRSQIESVISSVNPRIVVNTAAYTAVDRAETDREAAWAVNASGPAYLAEICAARRIPMLHLSTDFVFDGLKKTPYEETDAIGPPGFYGLSKAAGEKAVRERLPEHLIIRTSWLYGVFGNNFVKTILRLSREKEILRVVSDQQGSPTCTKDLALAVLAATDRAAQRTALWGTYHFCGEGITSWYGFAEEILRIAGAFTPLKAVHALPIATEDYPLPARRPAYSALNSGKFLHIFGLRTRPWKESLLEVLRELLSVTAP